MVDIWSKQKRSDVMSRIRSTGNAETELRMIKICREHGIAGWRRKLPMLGKPDFTFRRQRVVVFVDGCFWHGCPRCFRRPSSNQGYWDAKILGNRRRDRAVSKELRHAGWRVIRFWQHDLNYSARVAKKLARALAEGKRHRPLYPATRTTA